VVNSFTEAMSDHTAEIATPGADDLMTIAPDAGENTSLLFNDCVLSHAGGGGSNDAVVDVSRRSVAGNPSYEFNRTILSYLPRYGFQASGYGEPGDPSAFRVNFVGDATTRTVIKNCQRAVQSFFGPDRGLINFTEANVLDCSIRGVSLGATIAVNNATDTIFSNLGSIGFVLGHDDTWATTTMTRCTLDNLGIDLLLDVGTADHGSVIIRDSIISDSGGNDDTVVGTYGTGTGTWTVDIDNSAVVTEGNEAIAGVGGTGFELLGGSIVSGSPIYIQTADGLATDFYDVQSGAYATAGTGGTPLGGGADYVGGVPSSVPDWTLY
jgi:hypothetical protein